MYSNVCISVEGFYDFIASVDYETDRKIQDTIANEFEDRTILCIARKKLFLFVPYMWTDSHQTDWEQSLDTTASVCLMQEILQSLTALQISTTNLMEFSEVCATDPP